MHGRRTFVAATVLICGVVLAACRSQTGRVPESGETTALETVRSAENAATDAWNRGDLEAHVAIYADTGTGGPPIAPGGRSRARAALAAYFTRAHPTLRLDSLRVSALGPAYVLSSGRWTLSEGTSVRTGWFTHVWARLPVGWRIVYEHSS